MAGISTSLFSPVIARERASATVAINIDVTACVAKQAVWALLIATPVAQARNDGSVASYFRRED